MAYRIKSGALGKAPKGVWRGTYAEALEEVYNAPKEGRFFAKEQPREYNPDSLAETLRKAEDGCPDIVARIDSMREHLWRNAETESMNEYTRDVVGLFFDAAEVYLEPEHWFEPVREPRRRGEIKVIFNGGFNCSVPQENITRRGAVIAEVIDRLRENGPVSVYWRTETTIASIEVEMDTREGYSKNVLAFLLAHPGMLRRIGLCLIDSVCGGEWAERKGHGSAQALREKPDAHTVVFDTEGDSYLRGFSTDAKAKESAQKILDNVAVQEAAIFGEV